MFHSPGISGTVVEKPEDDDDEFRLISDLFYDYDKNVRPAKEKHLPVDVKFGIAYTQVVDLVGVKFCYRMAIRNTRYVRINTILITLHDAIQHGGSLSPYPITLRVT